MSEADVRGLTLRERKRRRTRALLIETGRRLFEERGYDETTVAEIAEAADIGTRTFFAYFDSKEQLLFSESDPRIVSAVEAIRTREPTESPAQVLLRGLDSASFMAEATNPTAQLRLRLMPVVPAIQARALRLQFVAQDQITTALREAYPDVDEIDLATLVGAFMGAVAAAFGALGGAGSVDDRTERVRLSVADVINPDRSSDGRPQQDSNLRHKV